MARQQAPARERYLGWVAGWVGGWVGGLGWVGGWMGAFDWVVVNGSGGSAESENLSLKAKQKSGQIWSIMRPNKSHTEPSIPKKLRRTTAKPTCPG